MLLAVSALVALLLKATFILGAPRLEPEVIAEVPAGALVMTPEGLGVVERSFREWTGLAYVVRLEGGRRAVFYRAHLCVVREPQGRGVYEGQNR